MFAHKLFGLSTVVTSLVSQGQSGRYLPLAVCYVPNGVQKRPQHEFKDVKIVIFLSPL